MTEWRTVGDDADLQEVYAQSGPALPRCTDRRCADGHGREPGRSSCDLVLKLRRRRCARCDPAVGGEGQMSDE